MTENLNKSGHFIAKITFVPTVPHCSLATLIGLCIRTKLHNELPVGKFKIDLHIKEGSHSTAEEITKQINDKERVAAALENPNLKQTVDISISGLTHEDLHILAVEAFQLQVHRQQDLFIGNC